VYCAVMLAIMPEVSVKNSSRLLRFFQVLFVLSLASPIAMGQALPAIGTIDYYGLRRTSRAEIERALQIKIGDNVPDSPSAAEQRLEAVAGVVRAMLNFTCCNAAGKVILYVGIEEKGSPAARFRTAPTGNLKLPAEIVESGTAFEKVFMEAVEKGDVAEDDSQGYALMKNPASHAVQEKFITFAAQDLANLRRVLHNSGEAHQRALAAEVLAFSDDKQVVAQELEYAMSDADSDVRNNAMRGLWVLAKYARGHPGLHLKISTHPFVKMLNSLVWTDRNKSAAALSALTASRDPALLADLREHALPSLVEMARWQNPGHSGFSCQILGRLAGMPEKEINNDVQHGEKEKIITAAIGTKTRS
jgi:hypothetical protein